MRRKDRQVTDPAFFDTVFNTALEFVLALKDGEYPYCVPLNFVRVDKVIYAHSAKDGHKIDLIRKDGHVAFSLACDIEIDRERSATYFKSVCGHGHASIVDDMEEKRKALDLLSLRYDAKCPRPASDHNVNRVAIIRIDIQEMFGKQCSPQGPAAPDAVK